MGCCDDGDVMFASLLDTTLSDAGVEGNAGLNSASANQDRWVSVGVIRDGCQILKMLGEVIAKGISCSKAPNCRGFPYFSYFNF